MHSEEQPHDQREYKEKREQERGQDQGIDEFDQHDFGAGEAASDNSGHRLRAEFIAVYGQKENAADHKREAVSSRGGDHEIETVLCIQNDIFDMGDDHQDRTQNHKDPQICFLDDAP